MYVLIVGNPVNGFQFIGPFADATSAADHGRAYSHGECWAVGVMPPPSEEITQ
jgi:hypothetical protein